MGTAWRSGVIGVLALLIVAASASAMVGPSRIDSRADSDELAQAVRDPLPTPTTPPTTSTTLPTPTTTVGTPPTTVDPRATAIVSLGDSFISGEAGRWAGNANSGSPGFDGTDRAHVGPGPADPELVYPGTDANGCHRSDVAPIRSTSIPVDVAINVACSSARTEHIIDTDFKGEDPQSEQLAQIAIDHDVRMIVLSIGGNDLGFADVVIACTSSFEASPGPAIDVCNDDEQPRIDQDMPTAMAGVDAAIDSIRSAMSGAGSSPGDYRLVVVSYPSPFPRGSEFRFAEAGSARLDIGGCPLWDDDATWARDSLTPQIADNLRIVAGQNGAEFLDLRDAFQGREACSLATDRPGAGGAPNPVTSEWTRWFESVPQGEYQENVHPNAYGQQAYGRCFDLIWNEAPGGEWTCTNTPGVGPSGMVITAL